MRKESQSWFDQGNEDIDTAEKLLALKKFSDASFYAHQACEKLLKALYIESNKEMPPKTHSLIELGNRLDVPKNILDNLKELNPEYVTTRYLDAAYGTPYETYTKDKAEINIQKARKIITWIQQKIKT